MFFSFSKFNREEIQIYYYYLLNVAVMIPKCSEFLESICPINLLKLSGFLSSTILPSLPPSLAFTFICLFSHLVNICWSVYQSES